MPVKVGSFVKNAASGASSQQVLHGLGVIPKAAFFYVTQQTAAGFANHAHISLGWCGDDMVGVALHYGSEDAAGTSDTTRGSANNAVYLCNDDAVILAIGDVSAWDANTFTFSWDASTTSASAYIVSYMIIGSATTEATALTNASDGDVGDDVITGAGFQPTFAMVGSNDVAGSLDTYTTFGILNLGWTDGTNQALICLDADNAEGTSDTRRYQRTNAMNATLPASDTPANVSTFGSFGADGMTLSVADANGTDNAFMSCLFMKGLSTAVGKIDKPTTAAPVTHSVTGLSFDPQGVILMSYQHIAATTVQTHCRWAFGFSDGTNHRSFTLTDADGAGDTNVAVSYATTAAYRKVNNDTDTEEAIATVALTSGGFDLSFPVTNDNVATEILYAAFGGTGSVATPPGNSGNAPGRGRGNPNPGGGGGGGGNGGQGGGGQGGGGQNTLKFAFGGSRRRGR